MKGAELHAVAAQACALVLRQRLDVVGHVLARHDAEILDEPEGEPARQALHILRLGKLHQRFEDAVDMARQELLQPLGNRIAVRAGELFVGDQRDTWLKRRRSGLEPGHGGAVPDDARLAVDREGGIGRGGEGLRAAEDLPRHRLRPGGLEPLHVRAGGRRRDEPEAVEPADELTLDEHAAVVFDCGHQVFLLAQPPHQHAGSAIDKTLCEAFMQGVRQPVLDLAGAALPVERVAEPVRAVGDERPGADVGDALGQRVDVAFGAVAIGKLPVEPVLGDAPAFAADKTEDARHQRRVLGAGNVAIVGDLADLPEQLHRRRRGGERGDVLIARHHFQRVHVETGLGARQALCGRRRLQRRLERSDRGERELPVAPLQNPHRLEAMVFKLVHELRVERIGLRRHPELAVVHVAPGAAGDLAQFGGVELAEAEAVVLAGGGERHMVEVHVEAHADGVGRHHVIHVAGLEQRHLRVAGARRQRAEDHRRAAPLSTDQFRHGVDHVGGERDDGGARRQPRQLLLARVNEFREARAGDEVDAGNQPLDQRPHGGCAQKHRLVAAAPVEQPIGEDVAAVEVARKLHLVDGEERHVDVARHRLHRRHPVARLRRNDFLLARHQRNGVIAGAQPHPVVDLPRQQPQRQADHAGRVGDHPLHGEVGLAGVGGSENGGHGTIAHQPLRNACAVLAQPVNRKTVSGTKQERIADGAIFPLCSQAARARIASVSPQAGAGEAPRVRPPCGAFPGVIVNAGEIMVKTRLTPAPMPCVRMFTLRRKPEQSVTESLIRPLSPFVPTRYGTTASVRQQDRVMASPGLEARRPPTFTRMRRYGTAFRVCGPEAARRRTSPWPASP